MANELAKRQPNFGDSDYDDGFAESTSSTGARSSFLRWTEQLHWIDRDGIAPPSPMLVHGVDESVRRWREINGVKQPEDITTKPLPDPEELNQTTPKSEWTRQLDGSIGAGWKHEVFVYLVNLGTGERYTYSNSTAGAHIAWEMLREAVITMRSLRSTKCYPLVNLAERPMPSRYRPNGMGMRPHFEIIGWKTPGEPGAVPEQSTPQLTTPTEPASADPAPTSAASPSTAAAAPSALTPPKTARRPKTPVTLSEYTLGVMGDVKPVTTAEQLNDSLDGLVWDKQ
jgi:hypothetical protein